ncbi:hypothetical protein [Pseudoalteromonas sp. S3260]|uniref:hypothetical protein n=1 Tax=Pseudoalteromonas sp. S3260 TaxID=579534 RepID=UPI00201DF3EB|nr:hypothetical protein [Pseudoalteromonas sp. S3260]
MPKVVIATKHKKAPLIAPALKPLGYNVVTTSLFDTDTLGMFSHEVQRHCSANTAALTKAQRACELKGEQFGLGSEGSFGGGGAVWGFNEGGRRIFLFFFKQKKN